MQLQWRLESIFMPYARRQRDLHYEKQGRFVHYTSAEGALSIIKSKRLWMRNTTCMADYREVQHGFEILNRFFSDQAQRRMFSDALDSCAPGAADEAIALFNQWWRDIRFNSYIASISEHDDNEDLHGRLSMWRAFGGASARVAVVFRTPYYSEAGIALNLLFSPVAYLTETEVNVEIHSVIDNINSSCEFLRSVSRPAVIATTFSMLVASVSCLKHEGFHEEREWRVIYSPKRSPSPLIEGSTEVISGIPQIIYKLPLDGSVSDAIVDLDFLRMFDRLIIGPSPYPWAMFEAFVEALHKAGVADAEQRVFTSGIPIRA